MRNYYITSNGKITRKLNTIYFISVNESGEKEKVVLPIERIYAIYVFGKVGISSGAISYLLRKNIPVHFFSKEGMYKGSLMPKSKYISGAVLVQQVINYIDDYLREYIAKEIVKGAIYNQLANMKKHKNKEGMEELINQITYYQSELEFAHGISNIMGIEGNCKEVYYSSWNLFLPEKFHISKRIRRPPNNMINSLVSYGNSLMYAACLTEIYHTQLSPLISYLHEPAERRYSLSLDIAEIFKPIISDRVIFRMINQYKIDESYFDIEEGVCLLNIKGKKLFLKLFNEKLKSTIRVDKKKVSHRMLIRKECYKLLDHILGKKKYVSLKAWW